MHCVSFQQLPDLASSEEKWSAPIEYRRLEAQHQPVAFVNRKQHHEFEETNELPLEPLKLQTLVRHSGESSELSPEAGVYTEGGLVFVPDSDSQSHAARKFRVFADLCAVHSMRPVGEATVIVFKNTFVS